MREIFRLEQEFLELTAKDVANMSLDAQFALIEKVNKVNNQLLKLRKQNN